MSFLIMFKLNIGEGCLGRRLLGSVATSALALSAITGAVVFSGGEAKALMCSFDAANPGIGGSINNCDYIDNTPPPGGPIVTPALVNPGPGPLAGGYYEVWYETNKEPTDKDIWFKQGPTAGKGDIEWEWIDVNGSGTWLIPPDPHSIDEWHVDVNFFPPLMPANGQSMFEYVVIIDKGQGGAPHNPWNPWFEDVTLSVMFGPPIDNVPPGIPSFVTKQIYEAICSSSTPGGMFDSCTKGSLINTLTVTAGDVNPVTAALLPIYDKLYIVDTAVPLNNDIDAYSNIYRQEVPGPLPLLGAGAAFGFSRKLRGRIKAYRSA
jgi:hypothetical protein